MNMEMTMDFTMMAWCGLILFLVVFAAAYFGARLART